MFAAVASAKRRHLSRRRRFAKQFSLVVSHRSFNTAHLANFPDQPLGRYRQQRAAEQIRLDAQIQHPGDGAGGIVGVQGREYQVAGEQSVAQASEMSSFAVSLTDRHFSLARSLLASVNERAHKRLGYRTPAEILPPRSCRN